LQRDPMQCGRVKVKGEVKKENMCKWDSLKRYSKWGYQIDLDRVVRS
jgi:hypothetical protein